MMLEMTRSLPGLLVFLMLSACAVIRPTRVDDPSTVPPPRLQQNTPGAELSKAPLTVEGALAIALDNNPDVVGDGWEIKAAQARKRQA